jgi:hypothetical protein
MDRNLNRKESKDFAQRSQRNHLRTALLQPLQHSGPFAVSDL